MQFTAPTASPITRPSLSHTLPFSTPSVSSKESREALTRGRQPEMEADVVDGATSAS